MNTRSEISEKFKIPGKLDVIQGNGSLPKVFMRSTTSVAEVYLHGAHVTHFAKNGEQPVLFCSKQSRFQGDSAIRGGVPIIFPWFGARAGEKLAHGFARLEEWDLAATAADEGGRIRAEFRLPATSLRPPWAGANVGFRISVGKDLEMQLWVVNESSGELEFEDCLHSYFAVGDIGKSSVEGLQNTLYLDKTDNFAEKMDKASRIEFAGEVDRTYLDTTATVAVMDREWRRKITVEKTGSNSTVVWNPWIDKAKQMADFGDDEYKQMVCVESGNIARNRIRLTRGQSHTLQVVIRSEPL